MGRGKMSKTIYVCHTYYHVYISILKEFARDNWDQEKSSIVLSTMSNDFEELPSRLKDSNIFDNVFMYDEQPASNYEGLSKYKKATKFFPLSIYNRAIFTKKVADYQNDYVPVNFREYNDIYVYCDSDPIGYYLNKNHIYYHAVEDGLDTLKNRDAARYDNRSHFGLKVFLSKKLNWIFIQNGYGKYCLDMEVNDVSILKYPCPYYKEVPRKKLYDRLTRDEKDKLIQIFVRDRKQLENQENVKSVLILTEPLCDLSTRKIIFSDLIDKYGKEYRVIIKQHPRDELDYSSIFPECLLIDRTVPMEILNLFSWRFDLVVSVFTELGSIEFADEKVKLGREFMDKYEAHELHNYDFASGK